MDDAGIADDDAIVGIPILHPVGSGIVPDAATVAVSAAGLLLIIAGKVDLDAASA